MTGSSGVAETNESLGSAKRLTKSMSRKILRAVVNDSREDAKGDFRNKPTSR